MKRPLAHQVGRHTKYAASHYAQSKWENGFDVQESNEDGGERTKAHLYEAQKGGSASSIFFKGLHR